MYVAQAQGVIIFAEDGSLVSGPNVVFSVLPSLFNGMGTAGLFVAVIFFVLMSVAALTSSIAILETLVSYVMERYGLARKKASVIVAAIMLGVSTLIATNIGWMLDIVVKIATQYGLPIIATLCCLFIGWIWHRNEILEELRQGNSDVENSLFWKIWPWYVKFICPVAIALVFFHSL
jgi:NSS family neurotransmitter:Na+ symporter